MIASWLLPVLLVAAALGRFADRIVARHDPALAVRALTAAAATVTAATVLVVYELLALVLSAWAPVARAGGWSGEAVADHAALPVAAGVLVGVAAAGMTVAWIAFAERVRRRSRTTRRFTGELDIAGGVAVVSDPGAPAYAVPGRGGVVVIDARLLPHLDARERRAVLAHERSHLQHRHLRYVNVAALAAAVNPLLRPLVAAVTLGTERWADEDAARRLGDRMTVARTLAKVGLFQHSSAAAPQLAMAAQGIAVRVERLLAPPPRRPARALLASVAAAATAAAVVPAVLGHVIQECWEAAGAGLGW